MRLHSLLIVLTLLALTACNSMQHTHSEQTPPTRAICLVTPTEGNECEGTVRFTQHGDRVRIRGEFRGLSPNSHHAIHIHEFGDITAPDGTAAGGHYNPAGHPHGLPDEERRHAGDFGNLQTDARGRATLDLTVHNITVAGDWHPIIGRAIIVHAGRDKGVQPTGDAGPRIGQGVIGVDGPE